MKFKVGDVVMVNEKILDGKVSDEYDREKFGWIGIIDGLHQFEGSDFPISLDCFPIHFRACEVTLLSRDPSQPTREKL